MLELHQTNAIFKGMLGFYNKATKAPIMEFWFHEFKGYPEAALLEASRLWCRSEKFAPTPEEFRLKLSDRLHGTHDNRPSPSSRYWIPVRQALDRGDGRAAASMLTAEGLDRGIRIALYNRTAEWFAEYFGDPGRFMLFCDNIGVTGGGVFHPNSLPEIFAQLPPRIARNDADAEAMAEARAADDWSLGTILAPLATDVAMDRMTPEDFIARGYCEARKISPDVEARFRWAAQQEGFLPDGSRKSSTS